jgi:hypothetical protein
VQHRVLDFEKRPSDRPIPYLLMALNSQRANRVLNMGFHEQHPTATIRCAIRNGPGRIQQHYPTLHLKPAATVNPNQPAPNLI